MKRLFPAVVFALSPFVFGFTMSWDRPTTRDDGSPVTPGTEIVYRVFDDNVLLASMFSATSVIIAEPGPGITHTYRVSALAEDSIDWSQDTVIVWTSPTPTGGGGCSMIAKRG
mgnify:CR=1 FL=1